MASTPEAYNSQPYGQPGQPPMYPNAAEMPAAQPVPYQAAPAPQPVAYAQPAQVVVQPVVAAPAPVASSIVQPISLGASSVMCVCPSCRATVTTTTVYEAGGLCWLICFGCLFFGLWLGCCLIPFCINECKDVVHKCPNCNALIGKYKRL